MKSWNNTEISSIDTLVFIGYFTHFLLFIIYVKICKMVKFRICKPHKRKFMISKCTSNVKLRFWITKFVITKRKITGLPCPVSAICKPKFCEVILPFGVSTRFPRDICKQCHNKPERTNLKRFSRHQISSFQQL